MGFLMTEANSAMPGLSMRSTRHVRSHKHAYPAMPVHDSGADAGPAFRVMPDRCDAVMELSVRTWLRSMIFRFGC
jgi:hypothetical protein